MDQLQGLTIQQVRSVILLVDLGSMVAVSQVQAISPSQVSRNVKAVEGAFGIQMFTRRGPVLEPSPHGLVVLPLLRTFYEQLGSTVALSRAIQAGKAGRLRLGYTPLTAFTILGTVLQRAKALLPGVEIDLRRGTDEETSHGLPRGELDVALVSPPVSIAQLMTRDLHFDRLALAMPAEMATDSVIRLDDPRIEQILVAPFSRWPGTLQIFLARCQQLGIQPRLEESVNDAIGRIFQTLAIGTPSLVSVTRAMLNVPGIRVVPIHGFEQVGYRSAIAINPGGLPSAVQLFDSYAIEVAILD
jgi:DNA-binding transcriptional LysR family regulator